MNPWRPVCPDLTRELYATTPAAVHTWEWLRAQRSVSAVRSGSLSFLCLKAPCQKEKTRRTTANSRRTTLHAQPFSRTYCCRRCVRNVRVSNPDTLMETRYKETNLHISIPEIKFCQVHSYKTFRWRHVCSLGAKWRSPIHGAYKLVSMDEPLHCL